MLTLLLSVVAIAAVVVVDSVAGPAFVFSIFYLLPVVFVTSRLGARGGAVAAAAVTLLPLGSELLDPRVVGQDGAIAGWAPWWNALMRGAACTLVIVLAELQRRALQREASLARTDALTGVANRRHFLDCMAAELERVQRYGHPLSVVFLDVDSFKGINDQHGHATGDAVLHSVAAHLQDRLRITDLVARIGGDEFALLLPEVDSSSLTAVLAALGAPLHVRVGTDDPQPPLVVHVTLGATTVTAEQGRRSVDDVIGEADRAMYAVKRAPAPEAAASADAG